MEQNCHQIELLRLDDALTKTEGRLFSILYTDLIFPEILIQWTTFSEDLIEFTYTVELENEN